MLVFTVISVLGIALSFLSSCHGFGVDGSLTKFIDTHNSRPYVELSGDRGKTWTPTKINSDDVNDVSSDPTGDVLVVVGSHSSAQVSSNRGGRWHSGAFAASGNVSCFSAAISSQAEAILSHCSVTSGYDLSKAMFASMDKGMTWKAVSTDNFKGQDLMCSAVSGDGNVFGACNGGRLMVSNNQGVVWRAADDIMIGEGHFVAIAFDHTGQHGATVFTNNFQSENTFSFGYKATADFGMTWQTIHEIQVHYSCEGDHLGGVASTKDGSLFFMSQGCMSDVIYMYDTTTQAFTPTASPKRWWTHIFTDETGANLVAYSDDYYCSPDSGKTWMICETMY